MALSNVMYNFTSINEMTIIEHILDFQFKRDIWVREPPYCNGTTLGDTTSLFDLGPLLYLWPAVAKQMINTDIYRINCDRDLLGSITPRRLQGAHQQFCQILTAPVLINKRENRGYRLRKYV